VLSVAVVESMIDDVDDVMESTALDAEVVAEEVASVIASVMSVRLKDWARTKMKIRR